MILRYRRELHLVDHLFLRPPSAAWIDMTGSYFEAAWPPLWQRGRRRAAVRRLPTPPARYCMRETAFGGGGRSSLATSLTPLPFALRRPRRPTRFATKLVMSHKRCTAWSCSLQECQATSQLASHGLERDALILADWGNSGVSLNSLDQKRREHVQNVHRYR